MLAPLSPQLNATSVFFTHSAHFHANLSGRILEELQGQKVRAPNTRRQESTLIFFFFKVLFGVHVPTLSVVTSVKSYKRFSHFKEAASLNHK